jgi:hypothetical protein
MQRAADWKGGLPAQPILTYRMPADADLPRTPHLGSRFRRRAAPPPRSRPGLPRRHRHHPELLHRGGTGRLPSRRRRLRRQRHVLLWRQRLHHRHRHEGHQRPHDHRRRRRGHDQRRQQRAGVHGGLGIAFTLQNLTIADGRDAGSGGGIANDGTTTATHCTFSGNTGGAGGALYNTGTLTLTDSTLTGNGTTAGGNGGAIYSNGTLTVSRGTIRGNTAAGGGNGGGIYNMNTLTIANSTIAGNGAPAGDGGGLYHDSDDGTVVNSTISGNSAGIDGANVFLNGEATFTNTIVAGTPGANCNISFPPNDGGHNIDDGATCRFTGSGCSDASGTSFCDTNRLLDPAGPANNGGPTQTIALLAGSPAIDHGDPDACADALVGGVDQRGVSRPAGQCDVGAFEVGALPTTTTVTTTTTSTTTTSTTMSTTTSTTSTSTVPGSCDAPPAPTFVSIDCRLDALIAQVQAATDLGRTQHSMLASLTKARERKVSAEGLAATKKKQGTHRLKAAIRKMTSFGFRVRSLVARHLVPAATRQSLESQGTSIRTDMKTLLRTL